MGDPVDDQIAAAVGVLRTAAPEPELLGVYLYGSAVADGLRPDSDIDLLALVRHRLLPDEKRSVVEGMIRISGSTVRPAAWRSLDVSVVAIDDVRPWRYPPRVDLQYGEWRRAELVSGSGYEPAYSPDLAITLSSAQQAARKISGKPLRELLDPIPREDLSRAMLDEVPRLLGHLEADTRNIILTLARIWMTLCTGRIVSKSDAAAWAIDRVPEEAGNAIAKARGLYLGGGYGAWDEADDVLVAADALVEGIRRASQV